MEGLLGAVVVAALGVDGEREERPDGGVEQAGAELRRELRVVRARRTSRGW